MFSEFGTAVVECNDLKRDWFFPLIRSFVGNVSTIDGEYIQMSEESGLGQRKKCILFQIQLRFHNGIYDEKQKGTNIHMSNIMFYIYIFFFQCYSLHTVYGF